jgi:hypothetical protein
MKYPEFWLIAASALLVCGCRFELQSTDRGFARLDKISGEVVLVAADGSANFPDLERSQSNRPKIVRVSAKSVSFRLPDLQADISLRIDRRWNDGSMECRFVLSPISETWEAALTDGGTQLRIAFADEDSFEVHRMFVPLAATDSLKGESAELGSLVAQVSVPMSLEKFEQIKSTSLGTNYSERLRKLAAQDQAKRSKAIPYR